MPYAYHRYLLRTKGTENEIPSTLFSLWCEICRFYLFIIIEILTVCYRTFLYNFLDNCYNVKKFSHNNKYWYYRVEMTESITVEVYLVGMDDNKDST